MVALAVWISSQEPKVGQLFLLLYPNPQKSLFADGH